MRKGGEEMIKKRKKVEWWRYVMSWIFYVGIVPLVFVALLWSISEVIIRAYAGFAGYFMNPTEKRSFKEEWKSTWQRDIF